MMRILHLNVRESKIVSDSRFHAMDFGFPALNSSLCWWDVDSGRQSFSQANLFSKPRIKKFVKSHKPVRKTYTDLKMLFPSI